MNPNDNPSKTKPDEKEIIPIEDNLSDEELSNENNVILGDEVQGASPDDDHPAKKGNHFWLIIVVIIVLFALLYLIKSFYLDA